MQRNKETWLLVWRMILMLLVVLGSAYTFMHAYYFTGVMLFVVLLLLILESYFFVQRYFSKIDKVVSSMLYQDYSVEFQTDTANQTLLKSIQLYNLMKERDKQAFSQKMLYDQILNGLDSGLIILKLSGRADSIEKVNSTGATSVEIMLMNAYFQQYFGVPVLKDWRLMEKYLGDFYQLLEERKFSELKTTLDIQVDQGERQTFVLQTSLTEIKGDRFFTVLIDSIQRVIHSKENEAWVNVMKVISHELMNSLAPIHALAQNMDEILQQKDWNAEDREDMQVSIRTIINRSNHLQHFVDRYRKLTMLPSPVLENVVLNDLVKQMMANYQFLLQDKEIHLRLEMEQQILAQVDPAQFEQVLVNLFTNSIQALANNSDKEMRIKVYRHNSRIFLEFMDNGPLIDSDIVSKIFLPFYTTRKDGAGIGLSLSKSIIEAHQGYLYYQIKEDRNCFVIVLMDYINDF